MKQKLLVLIILLGLSLSACGTTEKDKSNEAKEQKQATETTNEEEQKEAEPEVLDLTGNWEADHDDDSWMGGYIEDGVIEIYWISDNGDTKSLYWSGTYDAPVDGTEPYVWESKNDKDKTEGALLASGDDTKVFTYSDGELSFSASALGTTKTIRFKRTDTNYK